MSDEVKLTLDTGETVDQVIDNADKAIQEANETVTEVAAQPEVAPTLTLEPTPAPAVEEKLDTEPVPTFEKSATSDITLTVDPEPTAQASAVATAVDVEKSIVSAKDVQPVFTPEEQKMISDFAEKVDITNSNVVFSYGAAAQQQIASFSDSALKNVQTKDLGEVGDMISGLVTELRGFTIDDDNSKGGIFGFFKRSVDKLQLMKARYDHAEVNVNKIVDGLEGHQVQLLKDIATLDQLYEQNLRYFKELSMYIEAGKLRLKQVKENDLVAVRAKAAQSNLPEDAQAANDLAAKIDRFEKKIHDLELTRNISIQMAPQIRLLQNSNQIMAEKIQSSLVNTIPLWKSQMVLALGMQHTQEAMEAQRAVTDLTNDLLRKNAEMLHTATVETAKESERGIVDIETLKMTNDRLIQTMDEVLSIQQEGRAKRKAAEAELAEIESKLRAKLLEVKQ